MTQKVVVYHRGYGCDTGCCGHTVELFEEEETDKEDFNPHYSESVSASASNSHFQFEHPYDDSEEGKLEFAKKMVTRAYGEEHVKDLAWDVAFVTDNCL